VTTRTILGRTMKRTSREVNLYESTGNMMESFCTTNPCRHDRTVQNDTAPIPLDALL
jgi:hypothetical protein